MGRASKRRSTQRVKDQNVPKMVEFLEAETPLYDDLHQEEIRLYDSKQVAWDLDITAVYIEEDQEAVLDWIEEAVRHQELTLVLEKMDHDTSELVHIELPDSERIKAFLNSAYFAKPKARDYQIQCVQGLIEALCEYEYDLLCDYTFSFFRKALDAAVSKQIPIAVELVDGSAPILEAPSKLYYSDEFPLLAWYAASDAISNLIAIPWHQKLK